ncbi:HlyD family secretion protein [Desulfotomaculum copahuensis]|uniref:Secretion protein HlyD n=1 Tax=Desulfotomaculum copahuensis TaxID=1838280 RepID=A0A1B7LKQ3_9FIRM|nr:efflux RND transporter periplasmic adaptor subunit [Desulfotomaculum copahuensis]OAT87081.1 hypothetical protein A6M21_01975 [Desulfotomaculum copahuensis]
MQKRRCFIFPVLLTAVALLLAGCQSRGQAGPLTANGTIEATEVNVTARVGGTLQKLGVREGDRVKAGQSIGQLDTGSYRIQENQAQAGVAAAQAGLDEAESGARSQEIEAARQDVDALAAQVAAAQDQLTLQEDNLKRAQSLFQAGAIPEQALQEQQTACDTARHKLAGIQAQQEAARAKLELLQAGSTPQALDRLSAGVTQSEDSLKLARLNLDWTRLVAPISGTVISRNFEPGELIHPGAQVVTLLDDRDLWLNVYVPENQLNQVNVGQPVQIRVDAYPGKAFPGRVEYISPQAEFTPRNVQTKQDRVNLVFRVKVRVTGGWEQLKPGLPADVTFTPPETAK